MKLAATHAIVTRVHHEIEGLTAGMPAETADFYLAQAREAREELALAENVITAAEEYEAAWKLRTVGEQSTARVNLFVALRALRSFVGGTTETNT